MPHRFSALSPASLLFACAVVAMSATPGVAGCDLRGLQATAASLWQDYQAAELEARDNLFEELDYRVYRNDYVPTRHARPTGGAARPSKSVGPRR